MVQEEGVCVCGGSYNDKEGSRFFSPHEQAQQRETFFSLRPYLEADPCVSLTHSSLGVLFCIIVEPHEGLPLATEPMLRKLMEENCTERCSHQSKQS